MKGEKVMKKKYLFYLFFAIMVAVSLAPWLPT